MTKYEMIPVPKGSGSSSNDTSYEKGKSDLKRSLQDLILG